MFAVIRTILYGGPVAPDDQERDVFIFNRESQANAWVDVDQNLSKLAGIHATYYLLNPIDKRNGIFDKHSLKV